MAADCDQPVLTACYEEALTVPVSANDLLGVLAHRWHFSFILLVVKVEVAFFVAAGEHGVGE